MGIHYQNLLQLFANSLISQDTLQKGASKSVSQLYCFISYVKWFDEAAFHFNYDSSDEVVIDNGSGILSLILALSHLLHPQNPFI